MTSLRSRIGLTAAAAWLSLCGNAALAQDVRCQMTYGGVTKAFVIPPVSTPYDAPVQAEGSYFAFRVVNQTRPLDLASVKVYVYASLDSGPRLIQQGTWLASESPQSGTQRPHGFTGLQTVYEPVRDGELQYWCERLER